MELLKQKTGVDLTFISYRGASAAAADVLAGHVPMCIANIDSLMGQVNAGKLKPDRHAPAPSARRASPDTPTFAEAGFPDLVVTSWSLWAVPTGTPAKIKEKLKAATEKRAEGARRDREHEARRLRARHHAGRRGRRLHQEPSTSAGARSSVPRASSRNKHLVPDLLAPGLDLVFCGTAPSPVSFKARAYYANPGNAFWATLHAVGLTPERLAPQRYPELLAWRHRAHRSQQDRVRLRSRAERGRDGREVAARQAAQVPAGRHRLHQQECRVARHSASRRPPTGGRPSRWKVRSPSCWPRRRAARARSGRWSRGARRRRSSPRDGSHASGPRDAGAARSPRRRRALFAMRLLRSEPRMTLTDLARRAAIYLFPLCEMYRTRWNATVTGTGQRLNRCLQRLAPAMRERHARLHGLARSFGRADVPHPAGDGRAFLLLRLLDLFTDNFACVEPAPARRRPPPRMIAGPGWTGDRQAKSCCCARRPTRCGCAAAS